MPGTEIQQVVDLFLASKRAVALTGAGVSTPSGIPDFRSPSTGLWNDVNPMEVASVWSFRSNPRAFYDWLAPLAERMSFAEPNAAHYALAELERIGKLRAVITQNIDNLHQKAGSQRVLELHGHTRSAQCMKCGKEVPLSEVYEQWARSHEVPRCPSCGKGVLKPAVVLFGELLPVEVLHEAQTEARACDLMLVAGSSLEVSPASELPVLAYRAGAKVVIVNYEPTPLDALAEVLIRGDVAEVLPLIAAGVRGER